MSPSAEPILRLAHRPAEHILLYRKFKESPSYCKGFADLGSCYGKVVATRMTPSQELLPPRYRNPTRIGYGGMGEIFRAEDTGRTATFAGLELPLRERREPGTKTRVEAEDGGLTLIRGGDGVRAKEALRDFYAAQAATAAAEPLEDPPGVCPGLWGLRVLPGVRPASSAVTVLPMMTAPAARSMATALASRAGARPACSTVPFSVGMSAVSKMSLTPTGTP